MPITLAGMLAGSSLEMVEIRDDFEAIALRWIEDATKVSPSKMPDIVYHYTDAAGMIGMLSAGTIWATDYRFLNDRTEYVHTTKVARAVLSDAMKGHPDNLQSKLYSAILEIDQAEEPTASFVFSLSAQRDDLSQWRGYAREGMGFTLGLSGPELCKSSEIDANGFAFAPIEYEPATQSRVLKLALTEIEKQIRTVSAEVGADLDQIISDAASAFVWVRRNRGALNKHYSFRGEKEWRIVSYLNHEEPAKVRASGTRIIRYDTLDISLGQDKRLPLVEIGIGPGFSGAERAAVETLCRQAGYTPSIYFADTPYRYN
jgi:hypothetical protein